MPNKPEPASRRRLLQTILASGMAAGGGLQLKTWSRPVVQSIVLPAHATLTGNGPSSGPGPRSLTDPCFLLVNCVNDGTQVAVQAGGQVVGPPGTVGGLNISVTLRLMNGNSVVDSAGPFNTTTAGNGAWGLIPASPQLFAAAQGDAVEGVVSSPDATFTPDTCRLPFDCSVSSEECSSEWDKSSLSFSQMTVCNVGDGPATCATSYEIWYAASGNPKNGSSVASGTVGPLGQTGCHDFLNEVVALCGDSQYSGGRFKVKAYQHPLHPGTGELWSDTYICGVGFEEE